LIFKNNLFLSTKFYKKILILKYYFLDGWKFYCALKKKHPILYRIFMFIFRQSLNILGCGLIINYTKVGKALYSNSGLIFNIIDSEEISTKQLVIGAFIAAIVVIGGLFIKDLLTEVDSNRNDYLNEQAKNKELNKLIRQKDEEIVNLKEQKKSLLEKLEFAGKFIKDPISTVSTYLSPAATNTIAAEINNTSNTL
jgi:methyl-accepting chemotaxis protein